jgi:hypothetical protein
MPIYHYDGPHAFELINPFASCEQPEYLAFNWNSHLPYFPEKKLPQESGRKTRSFPTPNSGILPQAPVENLIFFREMTLS